MTGFNPDSYLVSDALKWPTELIGSENALYIVAAEYLDSLC